jgi:hypothetical protein
MEYPPASMTTDAQDAGKVKDLPRLYVVSEVRALYFTLEMIVHPPYQSISLLSNDFMLDFQPRGGGAHY